MERSPVSPREHAGSTFIYWAVEITDYGFPFGKGCAVMLGCYQAG